MEQLVYHIHSHLQVYVDGQPRALPRPSGWSARSPSRPPYGPFYGAQQCYYWLHTHATDGVIHVESPSKRIYTLGNFFDEWRQPLSRTQVASDKGKVTAFLNGKRWTQDPRAIPLLPHASIQLDVGAPTRPAQDHLVRRDESLGPARRRRRAASPRIRSPTDHQHAETDRRSRFRRRRARRARAARRSTRRARCPPPTRAALTALVIR